jgi:hypothetical protein
MATKQQQSQQQVEPSKADERKAEVAKLVEGGMSVQEARRKVHMPTIHDTPALLDLIGTKAMTVEEIAEATGHEVTPALKRRLSWLTERDRVLSRKVEGKGKNRVERYSKA